MVSNGYQEMVALLRKQIALEGKDKAFLLRLLQQASKTMPAQHVDVGAGEPGITPASKFVQQNMSRALLRSL